MAPLKRKYRTIYLVTAALMVAMIGGYALAATTLTNPGPTQNSNVTTSPTGAFTYATVSSEQLVIITTAMSTTTVAGAQVGVGLSGTTQTLAACAASPCAAQNFRPITPATETVGDYGEQLVLTVVQPITATGSEGFDFSITVTTSTTSVVFQGYLQTATTTAGASVNVPVYLYADLGTTTAPIINGISFVFNSCSTAAACP